MSNIVRIRGVDYPSQAAAARTLGVSYTHVCRALDRGDADSIGISRFKSVTIKGVEYPTASAAARALGVTPGTVVKAVQRGTTGNIGVRAFAPRTRYVDQPVTIRGVEFSTVAEASAHFGVLPSTIFQARQMGKLDRIGRVRKVANRKPMVVFGVEYSSRSAVAKHFGVCLGSLRFAIERDDVETFLKTRATKGLTPCQRQ